LYYQHYKISHTTDGVSINDYVGEDVRYLSYQQQLVILKFALYRLYHNLKPGGLNR